MSSKGPIAAGARRDPTTALLAGLLVTAVVIFGGLSPERFFAGSTWRAMAYQLPELEFSRWR